MYRLKSIMFMAGLAVTLFLISPTHSTCQAELIAFWHFEEPEGNFVADSVNGHHGTATPDVVPSTDCPAGPPGNTYSRSFPGDWNGGGIFVPDHPDLDLTGDFTIAMWAYRVDYGNLFIITKHRSGHRDGSWGMEWSGQGGTQVQFNLYGSPHTRVQSDPGVIPLEVWFHLALAYNESMDRYDYYVDGEPAGGGVAGIAGKIRDTAWPVAFGQIYDHHWTVYGGMLDEIQIWNECRTQAQIAEDMLAPISQLVIEAAIDIDPDTLNLKSKGRWITCYIELPEGYAMSDVDVDSILLEYLLEVEHSDMQDDVLMVKFDRQDVIAYIELVGIEVPANVTLMVTGELTDGTPFEGSDTIRVIDKGGKK